MAKLSPLWKTNPIQYLVLWKFPKLRIYSAMDKGGFADSSPEERAATLKSAERYRSELEALSSKEIDELISTAREDEARRYREYRENQERQRPFNQPDAYADFSYWASASYWSPEEAVALSFGRDPRKVNWKTLSPLVGESAFAKSFSDRRELVSRAIVMGQLFNQSVPSVFLAWADRMKIDTPAGLVEAVKALGEQIADWKTLYDAKVELIEALQERLRLEKEATAQQAALIADFDRAASEAAERVSRSAAEKDNRIADLEKQLKRGSNKSAASRERNTLLRLILGMAIGAYRYDTVATRSQTVREIVDDLQLHGHSIDEGTVRKYLNEAKDLLH